jgi:hypothetical protein
MMDPVFVNPSANNIFLQATSPCIDAGDPALPHDPNGSVADMGAYYYGQTPVASPSVVSTPEDFRLLPCYPNPFNAVTVIPFELSSPGKVTLTVYDVLGRKVAVLVNRPMSSGSYRVMWDATDLPSGIYFVRLVADGHKDVRKVILQK